MIKTVNFRKIIGIGIKYIKSFYIADETTGETRSMLIAYERPDVTGPKFSYYILSNIPDPASMEDLLDLSNGTIGKVVKDREVFIVTKGDLTARVHLDDVKDLGEFLEFEVTIKRNS